MEQLNAQFDDPKTWELLSSKRTSGVFQVEGHGLTEFLHDLRATRFETLVDVVSVYRPGPVDAGMVKTYVNRFSGKEPVKYDHPLLEPVLKNTYGIIIFQEQCLEIANKLAGYSLAEADLFRKAISSKKEEILEKEREKFISGCVSANGLSRQLAEAIFEKVVTFAGYGFNKSHGVTYALISFWTAYLKANYPLEYMASLLGSQDKEDDIRKYIKEAKNMDLGVLPPDINNSFSSFSIHEKYPNTILFGLSKIKGIGQLAADLVIQNRPYKDVLDFVYKFNKKAQDAKEKKKEKRDNEGEEEDTQKGIDSKTMETLIKAGCFRNSCPQFTTKQLLENIEAIRDIFKMQKHISPQKVALKTLELWAKQKKKNNEPLEYSLLELSLMERETCGFYISTHPLRHLRNPGALNSRAYITLKTIDNGLQNLQLKEFFTVGAIAAKIKSKKSRRGILFYELELEDEEKLMKMPIFGDKHQEVLETLKLGDVIAIKMKKGKNRSYVEKIKKIDLRGEDESDMI